MEYGMLLFLRESYVFLFFFYFYTENQEFRSYELIIFINSNIGITYKHKKIAN